jgi:hypothetical protein
MPRPAQIAVLVLCVLMLTVLKFTVSSHHAIRHSASHAPVEAPELVRVEDLLTLLQSPQAHNSISLCPSDILSILLSKQDDLQATNEMADFHRFTQQCPLVKNPIFHNHPPSNSLAERLLIHISHRLRQSPSLSDDPNNPDTPDGSEWLFFLPRGPSSAHHQAPGSPESDIALPTNALKRHHLIIHPKPGRKKPSPRIQADTPQQKPLEPSTYPATSILAIRTSPFGKALLERVLALQRNSPKRTEDEALAQAAAEYEFADSVLTVRA